MTEKEVETPEPTAPMPKPNEPKPINSIDRANAVVDRMEAANKEAKEILERQQELRAEQILGGHADAGQQPEQPKKEPNDVDYANSILEGSKDEA